jgi:hypothetical protein
VAGHYRRLRLGVVTILGIALAGCDGGDDGAVRFTGAVAGIGDIGRVELEVEASRAELAEESPTDPTGPHDPFPARGRLRLPGDALVTLEGRYDIGSETIYVAGSGYVLGGYLEHDLHPRELVFEGTYQGPAGRGRLSLHEGAPQDVGVLCGTFVGSSSGRWAVVLGPHVSTAIAVPYAVSQRSMFLIGLVSGGDVNYVEGAEYGESGGASASGRVTLDGSSAEGSWWDGPAGGDWEAAAAGCATP